MTANPLKRGTPPGSLRQFAVTYAPAGARESLDALYAFEAEIGDTVHSDHHEVAHTRLQWWRAEVDRLLGGNPQHPVTRALLPLRETVRDEIHLLHETLVAADIDLAHLPLRDARELDAYCFRAGGALQTLAALASASPRNASAAERDFARRLGSCVRRIELLRDLRLRLPAGRLPLPLDAIEAANVDPATLHTDTSNGAFLALLEDLRVALDGDLDGLSQALQPGERAAQRQGLVLAALHRKLLHAIDHRGGIARTRAEVPGWTRLWTAWRTAVRHA